MLLSNRNRSIFIHIPKTAGTSITDAFSPSLYEYLYELALLYKLRKRVRRQTGKVVPYNLDRLVHVNASSILDTLGESIYNEFYKFAFVRNPWDWHVSYYNHILRYKVAPDHEEVCKMSGFDEYLEWRCNNKYNPKQKDFITGSSGEIIVDFVGKYENLERDFKRVCDLLGLSVDLQHLNQGNHGGYRKYYNDFTKRMVSNYFGEDIQMFGYNF